MLSAFGGFYGALAWVEIAVIVLSLGVAGVLPDRLFAIGRRHVVLFGILWVAALTVEYWAFGPWSFAQINDEGELTVPLLMYRANIHPGGIFAHGLSGGADLLAMAAYNNGFVTLERILFGILPAWGAIGINKALGAGLAFVGAYILARRGGGADRFAALALAAFHTLAHRYMLGATIYQGMAYQMIPLAVYLLVYRLDRRFFYLGAVAVAVLHAVSTAPLHAAPAVGYAVGLAWLARRCLRSGRFLAGVASLVGVALANWAQVVFAVLQTAPFMSLVHRTIVDPDRPILPFFTKYFFDRSPETLAVILVALGWMAVRRAPRMGTATALVVAAWLIGPVMLIVPWHRIGLNMLGGFDFFYVSLALPSMVVLVAAWASTAVGPVAAQPRRVRWLVPAVVVFAVAFGQAGYQKAYNVAQWIWFGGQSVYTGYAELARHDWAPDHPFRVVTVPYRLYPNNTSAYGLESFDGFITNHPAGRSLYWRYGVCGDRPGCPWLLQTYVSADAVGDFQCCRRYDANRVFADMDALRVANVEYIVSLLPLDGPGLTHVAGPAPDTVPPRRGDPLMARLKALVKLIVHPEEPHVYRLEGALPRVFVAPAVETADPSASDAERVHRAVAAGLRRIARVAAADAARLPAVHGGRVDAVETLADGYRISVDMPQGGVLVVNDAWMPYWKATADGKDLPIVMANTVQMAIAVPVGAAEVVVRYRRPTLIDRILGHAGGRP